MAFKMKGSPMIKGTAKHKLALNKAMDQTSLPDGRAGSSAFQKLGSPMKQKSFKKAYTEGMTKTLGELKEGKMRKISGKKIKGQSFDEAFAAAKGLFSA